MLFCVLEIANPGSISAVRRINILCKSLESRRRLYSIFAGVSHRNYTIIQHCGVERSEQRTYLVFEILWQSVGFADAKRGGPDSHTGTFVQDSDVSEIPLSIH